MAVAVDAQGAVRFYSRGSHPVVQFNSDGSLVQAWNEDKERSLHQTAADGMAIGPDGGVWRWTVRPPPCSSTHRLAGPC